MPHYSPQKLTQWNMNILDCIPYKVTEKANTNLTSPVTEEEVRRDNYLMGRVELQDQMVFWFCSIKGTDKMWDQIFSLGSNASLKQELLTPT